MTIMRNIKLVEAVITLHDIARMVAEETGHRVLSDAIRKCADRLHEVSIDDNRAAIVAEHIIDKVHKNSKSDY